jgi:hypothetical protein
MNTTTKDAAIAALTSADYRALEAANPHLKELSDETWRKWKFFRMVKTDYEAALQAYNEELDRVLAARKEVSE